MNARCKPFIAVMLAGTSMTVMALAGGMTFRSIRTQHNANVSATVNLVDQERQLFELTASVKWEATSSSSFQLVKVKARVGQGRVAVTNMEGPLGSFPVVAGLLMRDDTNDVTAVYDISFRDPTGEIHTTGQCKYPHPMDWPIWENLSEQKSHRDRESPHVGGRGHVSPIAKVVAGGTG